MKTPKNKFRIVLSQNMLDQCKSDKSLDWLDYHYKTFEDYNKLYFFVISKWGSGVLGILNNSQKMGILMEEFKNNQWELV